MLLSVVVGVESFLAEEPSGFDATTFSVSLSVFKV